jgi:hypothetical protein
MDNASLLLSGVFADGAGVAGSPPAKQVIRIGAILAESLARLQYAGPQHPQNCSKDENGTNFPGIFRRLVLR